MCLRAFPLFCPLCPTFLFADVDLTLMCVNDPLISQGANAVVVLTAVVSVSDCFVWMATVVS